MSTIKEVRNSIKKLGYNSRQISVRDGGGCYSTTINITIKDLNIDKDLIEEATSNFEKIDRCEASGEILSGGNTFIFVSYDWEIVRDEVKKYIPEVEKVKVEASKVPGGYTIIEDGLYYAVYHSNDREIRILKRPDDYKEKECYCLDTIKTYNRLDNNETFASALLWIDKFFSRLK
jgi:hypothetical protein